MSKSKHGSADDPGADAGGGRPERGESGAGYGVTKHNDRGLEVQVRWDASEAQEVKSLREENAQLKKLVASLSLDKDALESVTRKNYLGS